MSNTFREYLSAHRSEIDGVMFDIDGTLSACGKALPGAGELLEQLRADGCPFLLLTNDSCHSREEKAQILKNCALDAAPEMILSAGEALKWWRDNSNYQGELFFQCGHVGNYALNAGINITRDVEKLPFCSGVIMGEGKHDWWHNLTGVFNFFLNHPERPMIVANPDSYWASSSSDSMGVGAGGLARFILALLHDAGIELNIEYLGKPYAPIYRCAAAKLETMYPGRKMKRLYMVGDSLDSDIRGANRNDMVSCLVLSGITNMEMVKKAGDERRPRLIFDHV